MGKPASQRSSLPMWAALRLLGVGVLIGLGACGAPASVAADAEPDGAPDVVVPDIATDTDADGSDTDSTDAAGDPDTPADAALAVDVDSEQTAEIADSGETEDPEDLAVLDDGAQTGEDAADSWTELEAPDATTDTAGPDTVDSDADLVQWDGPEPTDAGYSDAGSSDAGASDGVAVDAPLDATALEDAGDTTATADADDAGDTELPPPLPVQLVPHFKDITADFAVPQDAGWEYCVLTGLVTNDATEDLVLVSAPALGETGAIWVVPLSEAGQTQGKSPIVTQIAAKDSQKVLGCALNDVDDDGDPDLILTGSPWIRLFLNTNGTFASTDSVLPDLPTSSLARYESVLVGDFSGDGLNDLYVASQGAQFSCKNYECSYLADDFQCWFTTLIMGTPPTDRLLIAAGDGTYYNDTVAWNIPTTPHPSRPMIVDADGDGHLDLAMSTDFGPTYLLRNTGQNGFEVVPDTGLPDYAHAMGWGAGDLDRDGDLDLVQSDAGPMPVLLRAGQGWPKPQDPIAYVSLPTTHPLALATWGRSTWTPLVEDFNGDGLLDLYLGTAMQWKAEEAAAVSDCKLPLAAFPHTDVLALATGAAVTAATGWQLTEINPQPCGSFGTVAESAVDIDGDADLDVVQVTVNCNKTGRLVILRNDIAQAGQVARLRLQGLPGNRQAIGARVTALAGSLPLTKVVSGQTGPGSMPAQTLHFGLGSAAALTDVVVTWPNGSTTKVGSVAPGKVVVVQQP
jgi:hypothetical protein